jgi:hypothetical protein
MKILLNILVLYREDLQLNPNNQVLQNRLQDELRLQDFYKQQRDQLLIH